MTNLISKLRLDSTKGNSRNIWLMFILTIVLMGLNFRAYLIPELALIILTICISIFQIISLVGYCYWTIKLWDTWTKDGQLKNVLYLGLLILVTLLTADLAKRLFSTAMASLQHGI